MYGALWRALPGPAFVKAAICIILALAVVAALFMWVFPWVDTVAPLQDVTVEGSGSQLPLGAQR